MEALRDQYPALGSAPTIIQEALLFPYLRGFSFVSALWQDQEGRPAPFGPYLPQSTEQILRPSLAFGPEADMPTDLEIESPPGFEILYGNTFGQGEFEVLLEEHLGPDGRGLAHGWDGDRYALLRGSSGSEGLIWISVWDSAEERDRFVEGFRAAAAQLPTPGTLEGTEVLGRPGAILRVGIPGEVSVQVRETTRG